MRGTEREKQIEKRPTADPRVYPSVVLAARSCSEIQHAADFGHFRQV